MKRAKKPCLPYFESAHNCSRTRSEDQFLLANFSAPHFWPVPPDFGRSGDGTATVSNSGFKRLELLVYYAHVMH